MNLFRLFATTALLVLLLIFAGYTAYFLLLAEWALMAVSIVGAAGSIYGLTQTETS